jgi:hypothetical protein
LDEVIGPRVFVVIRFWGMERRESAAALDSILSWIRRGRCHNVGAEAQAGPVRKALGP